MAVFSLVTTSRWRLVFLLAMLPAAGLLSLAQPSAVDAATIAVNTTTDELNNDGDCSLREAIQAANTDAAVDACSAGSGADTIDLPAGTFIQDISGAGEDANQTGDWDITSDLTISGSDEAATIIRGHGVAGDRVLHIVSPGAVVEISKVTIEDGYQAVVGGSGGGILNAGMLQLTDSTVRGNLGGTFGGGLHTLLGGSADITNSTITGNGAVFGGGIANQGSLNVENSTIAFNHGFGPSFGGGLYSDGNAPGLKNTILADNFIDVEGGTADCSGTVFSFGYNLIEDTTGCTIIGDTTGNITGVDPDLGPLQDNGGTTATHALLGGSAAIDAGSPDCPPPPSTDQRGLPRFLSCDIGAFELAPVGGIAELPEAAGTALGAEGSSGPSVGLLAGISAAITSGALALGGAAWYARRRRLS